MHKVRGDLGSAEHRNLEAHDVCLVLFALVVELSLQEDKYEGVSECQGNNSRGGGKQIK